MFKDILQNLLAERNLTQRKLSIETSIPTTTISGWLNAGRLPDYNALKMLATYFDISADYLLGLEDEDGHKEPAEYEFKYKDNYTQFIHREKK